MYFSAEKSTDSAFLASLDRSAKNNTIPMELSGVKTHWHACMTEKPIGQVIVDEVLFRFVIYGLKSDRELK